MKSTAKMYYKSTDNLSNIPIKYCQKYSQFEKNLRNTFLVHYYVIFPSISGHGKLSFKILPFYLVFFMSTLIFTDCNMVYYDVIPMKYAAAAAKSLESCPTLCDPIDGDPPGSPIPGILQARTLEWVAISFSNT